MRGQLGTDVHLSVYKKVAEDIRLHNPTLVIFKMDCQDEITALCGPRYARNRDAEADRGGSEMGSILWAASGCRRVGLERTMRTAK